MKIGILTYHRANNYGAYLQACALCNRLNMEPGFDCEIIDFRMDTEAQFYNPNHHSLKRRLRHPMWFLFARRIHNSFIQSLNDPIMKRSPEQFQSNSIEKFQGYVRGKYDVIVAGSDEIWKTDSYRGFPTPYWLIGDLGCRKFSYAASSRSDWDSLSTSDISLLKKAIDDFEYVGVRDRKTFESVARVIDDKSKVAMNCDPSFVYDFNPPEAEVSDLLRRRARIKPGRKTMVVMVHEREIAKEILRYFRGDYNLVSVFDYHPGFQNVPNLSPLEWLALIKNADFVATSYFHGTCFSIVNQTPFISFGTRLRSSKVEELFPDDEPLSRNYISDTAAFLRRSDFKEAVEERMCPIDTRTYVMEKRALFNGFVEALKGDPLR